MGMFDYITIRCDKPEWMEEVPEWQTKDFDCQLEEILITENGRLARIMMEYGDGEVWLPKTVKDLDFTGTVYFYGGNGVDETVYVNATFKDGNLVQFERAKSLWDNL